MPTRRILDEDSHGNFIVAFDTDFHTYYAVKDAFMGYLYRGIPTYEDAKEVLEYLGDRGLGKISDEYRVGLTYLFPRESSGSFLTSRGNVIAISKTEENKPVAMAHEHGHYKRKKLATELHRDVPVTTVKDEILAWKEAIRDLIQVGNWNYTNREKAINSLESYYVGLYPEDMYFAERKSRRDINKIEKEVYEEIKSGSTEIIAKDITLSDEYFEELGRED